MSRHPATIRQEYTSSGLDESAVAADPFVQFGAWFTEALAADHTEPNAMALATATPDGRPSVRMVLLKDYDASGFAFYTNIESRKADELGANPRASLLFWWDKQHRQVRIEGTIGRVADTEADAYFATRPLGARIGAWASPQSRVVPGRATLEAAIETMRERHGSSPPRPPHWGGFRLKPDLFEFWQGQPDRLHDRLQYTPDDNGWRIERLGP